MPEINLKTKDNVIYNLDPPISTSIINYTSTIYRIHLIKSILSIEYVDTLFD